MNVICLPESQTKYNLQQSQNFYQSSSKPKPFLIPRKYSVKSLCLPFLVLNASWISHIAVNGFANTGNTYVNSRTTSSSGPSGNPFKFFLKYFSRTDLSKVCSEADIVNCSIDFLTVVCMAISAMCEKNQPPGRNRPYDVISSLF